MIIHYAIRNIHPEIKVITGDTLDDIICYDADENLVSLDESAVTAEIAKLQAEFDALSWKRSRQGQEGYPSVGDQLDMLMKDMKNNTTTHQEACEKVKAQFPKPE